MTGKKAAEIAELKEEIRRKIKLLTNEQCREILEELGLGKK